MKYTIEGFDQRTALEYGLDVADLVILRWFVDFMHSNRIAKVQHEGKEYCWIKYDGLLSDMPILGIKKKMLAIRLKKLVDAGVLSHVTKKDGGTYSLYAIGENYINLINSDMRMDDDTVGNLLDTVGNKLDTGRKNISQGVGNLLDTPCPKNCPPKDYSTKKDKSTKKDYSTKLYYPNDEKLNQAFTDFLEMRKAIKKPAKTERTIELLMKKLEELAKIPYSDVMDNDLAIQIVEQSTMNCWQGLFPLKEDKQTKRGPIDWSNV